jgi:hypothetical protein
VVGIPSALRLATPDHSVGIPPPSRHRATSRLAPRATRHAPASSWLPAAAEGLGYPRTRMPTAGRCSTRRISPKASVRSSRASVPAASSRTPSSLPVKPSPGRPQGSQPAPIASSTACPSVQRDGSGDGHLSDGALAESEALRGHALPGVTRRAAKRHGQATPPSRRSASSSQTTTRRPWPDQHRARAEQLTYTLCCER